jgi:DNA modification methylase
VRLTLDQIYTGDARELSKSIQDGSIDLIFTDPPYLREYLYLYEWLADEALRVLKPAGFMAVYVGIYHLADVIKLIGDKMEFFIELCLFGSVHGAMLWQRKTICRHKAILLYRPIGGTGLPRCNIISLFNGSGRDKRYHVWGQDESSARYYVDCLSRVDDVVLDPFCGGGTTPAICRILKRHYLSFELSPETADIARARVINQQMPLIDLGYVSNELELVP